MLCLKLVSLAGIFLATTLTLAPTVVFASDLRAMYNSLESRYAHAHSLDDTYRFDPRDGWQSVNVTNLQYKYANDLDDPDDADEEEERDTLEKRASKKSSTAKPKSSSKFKSKAKSKSKSKTSKAKTDAATSKVSKVTSSIQNVVNTIKGVGKPEPVTITWYTGHDLENPSCWSNPVWAPTVSLLTGNVP